MDPFQSIFVGCERNHFNGETWRLLPHFYRSRRSALFNRKCKNYEGGRHPTCQLLQATKRIIKGMSVTLPPWFVLLSIWHGKALRDSGINLEQVCSFVFLPHSISQSLFFFSRTPSRVLRRHSSPTGNGLIHGRKLSKSERITGWWHVPVYT